MSKKIIMPDYNNSIVSLACSIRKYFDLDYNHNTNKTLDNILEEKKPKNVVVILFDGMGSRLIKRILGINSFLYKNMSEELSSVCPPTTTASTTSMLTGLTPKEHGWLGWDLYFKEENKIVTMFTNCFKDTNTPADDINLSNKYFPYKNITESINEDNKYYSKIVASYNNDYTSIDEMLSKIKNNLNIKEKNYIYAYNPEPDSTLHHTGTDSNETIELFKTINNKVEEFSKNLKDTLLIVIADHGHINCEEIVLEDYKDLFDTFDGNVWIEGRMCSFKIKKGREEEFTSLFNKYFKNDFILKTKKEIIDSNIFGDGIENKYFKDSLGDYFSLAVGNKYFRYKFLNRIHKSNHAGFTLDEMKVPLIIIDKTNNINSLIN